MSTIETILQTNVLPEEGTYIVAENLQKRNEQQEIQISGIGAILARMGWVVTVESKSRQITTYSTNPTGLAFVYIRSISGRTVGQPMANYSEHD